MNKILVFGVLSVILLVGLLGVAYAEDNESDDGSVSVNDSVDVVNSHSNKDKDKFEDNESKDEDEENEFEDDSEVEIEEELEFENDSDGAKYTKKVKEEYSYKVIGENGEEYEIEVRSQTRTSGNETEQKIKIQLSNGQDKEIKIMPETASQTAIDKLKSRNISVILKEVGEGNNLSVVYEADANKTVKFLGLFKVKAEVKAVVDSETGEVVDVDRPWWYFMAFGKNKYESSEDNNETQKNETELNETGVNVTLDDNSTIIINEINQTKNETNLSA